MADDDARRGDGGDAAPGIPFMNSFNVMEDVLDKLKLLDYETSFCKEWGFKSFPRYAFKFSKTTSTVCTIYSCREDDIFNMYCSLLEKNITK